MTHKSDQKTELKPSLRSHWAYDASTQQACALDIVRQLDTIGDSEPAVYGSSGGGTRQYCSSVVPAAMQVRAAIHTDATNHFSENCQQ